MAQQPAPVFGADADAHRLPPLDHLVVPGDNLPGGASAIYAPGHTQRHVAFHVPAAAADFTDDSLMTHGCGRLFEGTADDMHATICRLDSLPPETRLWTGHDYACANLAFAARYAPNPAALAARERETGRAREGACATGRRWAAYHRHDAGLGTATQSLSVCPTAAGGGRRRSA